MAKKTFVLSLIFGLLVLGVSGCSINTKPNYSAEAITTNNGYSSTCKIYVSGKKYRIDGNFMGRQQILIYDNDHYMSYLLLPDQKIAQIHKLKEVQAYETIFGSYDKKLARDFKREKLGADYVEGIECDKYKLTHELNGNVEISYAWYSKEGILVKRVAENGAWSMELHNLVIEKQPASLFEVPDDYKQVKVPR